MPKISSVQKKHSPESFCKEKIDVKLFDKKKQEPKQKSHSACKSELDEPCKALDAPSDCLENVSEGVRSNQVAELVSMDFVDASHTSFRREEDQISSGF